jgi:hypothetical protein
MYLIILLNAMFLLEHEITVKTIEFRADLGVMLIGLLSVNFLFNIGTVFYGMLNGLFELIGNIYVQINTLVTGGGSSIVRRHILLERLGKENLKTMA